MEIKNKENKYKNIEKEYEKKMDKRKITIFRLDGHAFSKLTSKFEKPFDINFTNVMKETALKTFNYYDFSLGYVGSDEITLCILPRICKTGELCNIQFEGRIQKMTTLLSGFVSVVFYKEFNKFYPMDDFTPHFDCKVYQVDTIEDALKNISDRITFTLKNSRMMFAQNYFSHKKLYKISSINAIKMVLDEFNIDYNKVVQPNISYGTVITKENIECEKEIIINKEKKIIKYNKNIPKENNILPEDIFNLQF